MRPYVAQGLANQDIVAGWRFSATLQLRTPLQFLLLHGVFHPLAKGEPPEHPIMHGIWVTETKTNAELGIGLPDLVLTNQTCASEIGQVPSDGGDFLKFLIAIRNIKETAEPAPVQESILRAELGKPDWSVFVLKLGGTDRIIKRLKARPRKLNA
ncbi:hypothetical protein [Comamonas sp. JNW]|uniref:hypothetical protein n=1 Tax=Comamonas sp. JNW TaxID=2170731 RepID=UPI000DE6C213|nr:hypothetical protein [Comamonas sp. JNW]PWB21346.1 hypothetical protein DCO45_02820 [Comamonas sp. JNW]